MKQNYIYSPALATGFKCKVPLKDACQLFIVNGKVQGGISPFVLDLKDGENLSETLQLISVRNEQHLGDLEYSEAFHFGKNSRGKVVMCSHTFSLDDFVTRENVNIILESGARAEFVVMQNEHNKAIHNAKFSIKMADHACLTLVFLSLHGGEINNTVTVDMNGEYSECNLGGLYLTDSTQLMNNTIDLNHFVPNCKSNQLFKGILDDNGITRFFGRINVAPGAQKTEAFQANHNLLISDKAKAYSKPQLEIYADDVKCSHGATVGRLNEMELFYMRTRGIPSAEARLLQQMAFAYEVLEKISNEELRERMQSLVEKRLRGEFSQCKNCSKNCC
ncbi:MAG: SufD family Fe-S cluster assembly protein [Bacteroidales bacterium]|nr:SufD family Fe-S cluster assembly protein [Bacteroidales bacterium]MDD3200574.1 SufD family Fe-S cluster assembly protein [Bacteroidales bacterium]